MKKTIRKIAGVIAAPFTIIGLLVAYTESVYDPYEWKTAAPPARGIFQMVIVCTRHKTARDIRPLYDVTIPKKQKPYHGIKVEAELVILGGTRLKVYDKKEETWEGKELPIM